MYKPRARQLSDGEWVLKHDARGFIGHGETIKEAGLDGLCGYWRSRAANLVDESLRAKDEMSRLEGKVSAWSTINTALCIALGVSLFFHVLPYLPF